MSFNYSDPIHIDWITDISGNKVSIEVTAESKTVVDNMVVLDYVPDYSYRVSCTSSTPTSEIELNETISSADQYKVNYTLGIVYVDSSLDGQTLTFDYYKRGVLSYPASRIYYSLTGGSVSSNIKDLLDTLNGDSSTITTRMNAHVGGTAEKHNSSEITNDSSVSGSNVDNALDNIDDRIDAHVGGTAEKHSASEITNDSTVSGTNTDDALDTLQGLIDSISSADSNAQIGVYSMSGTGTDSITASFTDLTYFGGLKVLVTTDGTNTTIFPTINIESNGVKSIKLMGKNGNKVSLSVGDMPAKALMEYDGTDFILLNPVKTIELDSIDNKITNAECISDNLLPDTIALCEDSSLFTNSNTTDSDDSDNAKYGKYATKITLTSTTGDISYDVLDLMDSNSYYAVIMEAKNGDLSGSGIRLDVNCVGDVTTNPSAYITITDYTRKAILLQPSDFNGASAVEIEVELDGSSSEYAYLDNLTLRKITKKEYDEGETALLSKYPFASSKGIETYEEIVSLGDDLYDGMLDVYLEGRSLVNLTDGITESASGWSGTACTVATDSTDNLEGTNCLKLTLTNTSGYATYDIIDKLDTSKYYMISIHQKNEDLSGNGIRFDISSDDQSYSDSYDDDTFYERKGIVLQPTDFDTATYVNIKILLDGAIGEYGFIDAIQTDEITAEDYNNADANGTDVLFPKYPYHRGLKSAEVGRVKSVGTNLFDWDNIEVGSINPSTGQKQSNDDRIRSSAMIKVTPNTDYYFNMDGFGIGQSKSVIGYSDGNFDNYANNYVGVLYDSGAADAFTFNTGDSSYIGLKVNEPYSSYTGQNIQLELGSSATTYEPHKSSQFYSPVVLRGVPSNADSFRAKDGRHDKRCEEHTLLSGDIDSVADGTNLQRAVIGLDAFAGIITQTTGLDKTTVVNFLVGEASGYDTAGDEGKWYTDASNLYIMEALGTWADVAAARTALTSTVVTKIVYELDPDSYETTYYPSATLNAYVNGTIHNENVELVEATYDSGLSVDNTDLPISSLDYIYKLVDDVWTPIDISTATFDSGDTDFTLSGASDGERYSFAYRPLFGSVRAKMYYDYCTSTKAQADGLSEQVVELDKKIDTVNSKVDKHNIKTSNIVLGAISSTTSYIAFVSPENCEILDINIVTKDAITANDTNYWTINLINKGSDGTGIDNITDKDTTATSGEGFTAYTLWSGGTIDIDYSTLSKGDVLLLTFTKSASATAFAEAFASIKYKSI